MKTKEKLIICIEAFKELLQPKGAYNGDRLIHAQNTINETAKIALETLEKIGEIKITEQKKHIQVVLIK